MAGNTNNCCVVAIAAITGEPPAEIVAGLSSFPGEDGGPAFRDDGVDLYSVGCYLESRGWEVRYFEHDPSIPWTSIVSIREPGHVFAIVDGRIYDPAGLRYDGCEVDAVFVPPRGIKAKLADHGRTGGESSGPGGVKPR